jgi:hypothetical protein
MAQDGSLWVGSQVAENFILHRENFATEPEKYVSFCDDKFAFTRSRIHWHRRTADIAKSYRQRREGSNR